MPELLVDVQQIQDLFVAQCIQHAVDIEGIPSRNKYQLSKVNSSEPSKSCSRMM